MTSFFRSGHWSIVAGVLACSTTSYPQTVVAPVSGNSKVVLAMDGPGGRVALGDSLEQAKKAFPASKGAHIMEAMNYAIFQRPGWSWATDKPVEAFEVSLKEGQVVGILRTVVMPSEKSRQKLIEQTIQKVGNPTNKAEGKTVSIYVWDAKPNARFLIEMRQGFMSEDPVMMAMVGSQDDLKMLNYRVDDVKTLVKQMDLSAQTFENLKKEREKKQGTKTAK